LELAYYIAPEVLKKNYDEKCDIWSCGVILHILFIRLCSISEERVRRKILEKVEIGYGWVFEQSRMESKCPEKLRYC